MNYRRIYNELIGRAKARDKPQEKTERHHIVPAALGGTNEPSNLVDLTLREHYIAHVLIFRSATTENEKIRMFQPIKLMVKNLENTGAFNSRKFEAVKASYYKNHQMLLEEVRAKVSEGVKAANINRGCKELYCACGCKQIVALSSKPGRVKKYIKGHYKPTYKDMTPTKFICACGCGQNGTTAASKIKMFNYLHGHYRADPLVLSAAHKKRLSGLTKEELSERTKILWGKLIRRCEPQQ